MQIETGMRGSCINHFLAICLFIGLHHMATTSWAENRFSLPKVLNTNAFVDSGNEACARFGVDNSGTWIAVWAAAGPNAVSSAGDEGAIFSKDGKNEDIFIARSIDNGKTWSAPTELNPNYQIDDGDDLDVDIAGDGFGKWVVVWRSRNSLGGTTGYDGDILVSHSTDNGATWTAPTALNINATYDSTSALDYYPHIATDNKGKWVVVWSAITNVSGTWVLRVLASTSSDTGVHWSNPVTIQQNQGNYSDAWSVLETDGNGRWIAAWSYSLSNGNGGTDYDILYSVSNTNGSNWTAPAMLNQNAMTDTGNDGGVQLATDKYGNWVATWSSTDSLNGTIGTDADMFVAHSTDNGNTWSYPGYLNTNAPIDFSLKDGECDLSTNRHGEWLTAWVQHTPEGFNILYSVSRDIGVSWDDPVVLNRNQSGIPAVCTGFAQPVAVGMNRTGHWMVCWSTQKGMDGNTGSDYDLMYVSYDKPHSAVRKDTWSYYP